MHEREIRESRKLRHSADASGNHAACSRRECLFPTPELSAQFIALRRLNPHVASRKRAPCEQQLDLSVFFEHDQRDVTDGILGNFQLMRPRRV